MRSNIKSSWKHMKKDKRFQLLDDCQIVSITASFIPEDLKARFDDVRKMPNGPIADSRKPWRLWKVLMEMINSKKAFYAGHLFIHRLSTASSCFDPCFTRGSKGIKVRTSVRERSFILPVWNIGNLHYLCWVSLCTKTLVPEDSLLLLASPHAWFVTFVQNVAVHAAHGCFR